MHASNRLIAYLFSASLALTSSAALAGVYHEFSPKKTELVAIVSPATDYASHLIRRAKKKYGDRIEFAVNGSYFDPRRGKSCGKIISEGKELTSGVSNSGIAWIYDSSYGGMLDIKREVQHNPDFLVDGFVSLLPEYETNGRSVNPSKKKERMITAIKKDGNGVIIYRRFTPREGREFARRHHFVCAAMGDGGSSAMFYRDGKYAIKPGRKLKSIIVGVRKKK